LHLADFDTVDLTNLQRQIIHDTDSVGMSKVDSALKRLSAINPEIQLIAHRQALDEDSLAAAVAAVDLVLDCSDNFSTREAVNAACVAAAQTAGQRRGDSPRRAAVGVRPASRRKPVLPLFIRAWQRSRTDVQRSRCGRAAGGSGRQLQALEALKVLVGFGEPLVGRLLLIDALGSRFRELRVKRDPGCSVCGSRHA
jgi:molybdopterin/thiamine biosynthesis adenylyltransferase